MLTTSFRWIVALAAFAACGPAQTPAGSERHGPPAGATASAPENPLAPAPAGAPPTGPVDIEGVVRAPDGTPVAGAHVAVNAPYGAHPEAHVRSGPDGRFRAPVTSGSYVLTATAPGHTAAVTEAARFDPGARHPPAELRLGAGGFTVRGAITDPDGRPAGEVDLLIYHLGEPPGGTFYAASDDGGRYEVTLPSSDQGYMLVDDEDALFLVDRFVIREARDQALDLTVHRREPASPEVVRWIADNAVPLTTVVAGSGFDDMGALRRIVGRARVVGLGEATHGTREFFQLKHRVFEYLVEEMGFTVFAIEANFTECLAINDYVLHGVGDPRAGLDGIYFWTWNTEEVLAVIEWMRAYNADPKHRTKLRFYGVDMQVTSVAVKRAANYVARLDPEVGEALAGDLAPLATDDIYESYPKRGDAEKQAVRDALARGLAHLDRNRRRYVANTDRDAFAWARGSLAAARQTEEMLSNLDESFAIRDKYMAANVEWILGHEPSGTRVALWAANGHIMRNQVLGMNTMGKNLDKALGADYVPIGFTFDRGSFQAKVATPGQPGAMTLQEVTVGPAPAGNVGAEFSRAGIPIFALDLRRRPRARRGRPVHPATAWLEAPHLMRNVGATFGNEESFMLPFRLTEQFDVMMFVDQTARARPLEASTQTGQQTDDAGE